MSDHPVPEEPRPPESDTKKRRRRLACWILSLTAAVLLFVVWRVSPTAEEWRHSGDWYLADVEDGTVTKLQLRPCGSATYRDADGDRTVFRWSIEEGKLLLATRLDDSILQSLERVVLGEPTYSKPDIYPVRLSTGRMQLLNEEGEHLEWLCRTPNDAAQAARAQLRKMKQAAADANAAKTSVEALGRPLFGNELALNLAAAVLGGPLWEVRTSTPAARVAVFERGPEGVRLLLMSPVFSQPDRVFVGYSPLTGTSARLVCVHQSDSGADRVAVDIESFPFEATETSICPDSAIELNLNEATPVATLSGRQLLIAVIADDADAREVVPFDWTKNLPAGIRDIDRPAN